LVYPFFIVQYFTPYNIIPALSLDCIQCDRQGVWYSPEENERHIMRCQRGLIPPTRCTNTTHTHCIFNYYKKTGSKELLIRKLKNSKA
jgi:hypothetical protein